MRAIFVAIFGIFVVLAPTAAAAGQSLRLTGPSSATVGTPVTFDGLLTNGGQGVGNALISIYLDGERVGSTRTEASGAYSTQLAFDTGLHEVTAKARGLHASVFVNVDVCGAEVCIV
jgi:hypothetical protein